MFSDDLEDQAEQTRRDGYAVISLADGPMLLSDLIKFAQAMFPNHKLNQLAITEVNEENDGFVVAAQLGIDTRSN